MHFQIPFLSSVLLGRAQGDFVLTVNPSSFGTPGTNATYDYVVVGGGTGGNAIAARLAAGNRYSVAVVEAGGFYEIGNGNGSIIPANAGLEHVGTDPDDRIPLIDWNFLTVPQRFVDNRVLRYARGKTLGGSSSRNYMALHRGTIGSYSRWAEAVGDDSYEFSKFSEYYKKSVHVSPPRNDLRYANSSVTYDSTAFSDDGGPMQGGFPNFASAFGSWVMKGLQSIGVNPNPVGFNSGLLNGSAYGTSSITPKKQHRSTSQNTYLKEAMLKTNIQVYTSSLAKQITFNEDKMADGVIVETDGIIFKLSARKEVILSAGAFQSPQLLMVSGVGPKDTLKKFDIPVVQDLPGVGQNMEDHTLSNIAQSVYMPTQLKLAFDPAYAAQVAMDYNTKATGPLTSPPSLLGWEKLSKNLLSYEAASALAGLPRDWPEVEYIYVDAYLGRAFNAFKETPTDGRNYGSICFVNVAPLSRGSVTISSADMSDPPLIDPNYFSHPVDMEVMIAGFKRVRAVWNNISSYSVTGPEYFPGPNITSDADIAEFVRNSASPVYHASCTCKMGKESDPMAVVNSKAQVFGVKRLRVVDASAFALLLPGHPQATVYALAEKIADDILSGR